MSRGGLCRYFPGKAELLWGLLAQQDEAALARRYGLADNGGPLAVQIPELFTAQVAHAAVETRRARMILEFCLQPGEDALRARAPRAGTPLPDRAGNPADHRHRMRGAAPPRVAR